MLRNLKKSYPQGDFFQLKFDFFLMKKTRGIFLPHTINSRNILEMDLTPLFMAWGYDVLLHMKNAPQSSQEALLYDKNTHQVGWMKLEGTQLLEKPEEPLSQLIEEKTCWDDSTKMLLRMLKAKIQYKKEFQGSDPHFFSKGIEVLQEFIVSLEED